MRADIEIDDEEDAAIQRDLSGKRIAIVFAAGQPAIDLEDEGIANAKMVASLINNIFGTTPTGTSSTGHRAVPGWTNDLHFVTVQMTAEAHAAFFGPQPWLALDTQWTQPAHGATDSTAVKTKVICCEVDVCLFAIPLQAYESEAFIDGPTLHRHTAQR